MVRSSTVPSVARPTMRSRKRFMRALAVALLVPILAACAGTAAEGQGRTAGRPDEVNVVVIEGTQQFPMQVLQKKGIAEKHNLRLNVRPVAGPQAFYPAVQQQNFQVGFGAWTSIARLRQGGVPVTNVYSVNKMTNDVMVPAGSQLDGIEDLEGRKVGIYGGPAGGSTTFFRLLTKRFYGYDVVKDTEVQFGAPGLLASQLASGKLDAALLLDPFVTKLMESGKARSIGDIGAQWTKRTGNVPLFVTVTMNENWAQTHPDVVRRFVAAYQEALTYLQEHPEVWKELAPSVGITSEEGVKILRQRVGGAFINRWDQKLIDQQLQYAKQVIETIGKTGDFPKEIPEGTFTLDYLPKS